MIELFCHLLGDYFLQSDWMAVNKTREWSICLLHAMIYATVFFVAMIFKYLPLKFYAFLVILSTHFLIDYTRLAKYIGYAKNLIAPKSWRLNWELCKQTGYCIETSEQDRRWYSGCKPEWMAVWLMIILDNTLHIMINHFSLLYL